MLLHATGILLEAKPNMETLSPELERQLQVEELWARRVVLAGVINASRLEIYRTRRMLVGRADVAIIAASSPHGQIRTPTNLAKWEATPSPVMRRVMQFSAASLIVLLAGIYGSSMFANDNVRGNHVDKQAVSMNIERSFLSQRKAQRVAAEAHEESRPAFAEQAPLRPLDHDLEVAFAKPTSAKTIDSTSDAQDPSIIRSHRESGVQRPREKHVPRH